MAIFVKTNAGGLLTYENQPDEIQALLSNLKELTNAEIESINSDIESINSDIETIFSAVDGTDMSSSVTLTAGINCESVTLLKAVKHSNVLYMQFTAAPSTRISTAGSVGVTVSGAAPDAGLDWRIILGAAGTAHYHGFLSALSENGCTIMLKKDSAVWELEETVNFSTIIPLS